MSDFAFFTRVILGYDFLDADMHTEIMRFIETAERDASKFSLLLAPRGHGKSFIVTTAYPLWRICRSPNSTGLILHGSESLAEGVLKVPAQHMEQNEMFRDLFPDVVWTKPKIEAPFWNASKLTVRRTIIDHTPTLEGKSAASAKTGSHYDYIICDDLVNKDNVGTPEQMQKVKDFIRVLPPLLKFPHSRIFVLGTRWHFEDAYGWMMEDKTFGRRVRPLVMSCYKLDGSPMWPTKHTIATLEEERDVMGPYLFSANYLNAPSPEGTMLFSEEKVNRWIPDTGDDGKVAKVPDREGGEKRFLNIYTAVDPNAGQKEEHDMGVVMTVGRDAEGNFWVLDVTAGHPAVEDMVIWIRNHVKRWKPGTLFIETVAYQKQLANWLRKDSIEHSIYYPIKEIGSSERGRTQKFTRIRALDPVINCGKLWVPHGSGFDEIVAEIAAYSSAAKHDDHLDCLADIGQYGVNPPSTVKAKPPSNPNTIAAFDKRFFQEERRAGGFTDSRALGRVR